MPSIPRIVPGWPRPRLPGTTPSWKVTNRPGVPPSRPFLVSTIPHPGMSPGPAIPPIGGIRRTGRTWGPVPTPQAPGFRPHPAKLWLPPTFATMVLVDVPTAPASPAKTPAAMNPATASPAAIGPLCRVGRCRPKRTQSAHSARVHPVAHPPRRKTNPPGIRAPHVRPERTQDRDDWPPRQNEPITSSTCRAVRVRRSKTDPPAKMAWMVLRVEATAGGARERPATKRTQPRFGRPGRRQNEANRRGRSAPAKPTQCRPGVGVRCNGSLTWFASIA